MTPQEAREDRRSKAVQMRKAGYTRTEIARTVGVSAATIAADLTSPKSREELTAYRQQIRQEVMERTLPLVKGTLDVVQQAISDRDAKSLELSTRAAVNLDKLTASASGETQKVEVTGQVNVDVRALLAKYAAS